MIAVYQWSLVVHHEAFQHVREEMVFRKEANKTKINSFLLQLRSIRYVDLSCFVPKERLF